MLSSTFLLVAPFLLLAAPASAAPKNVIKLNPQDDVEVQCVGAGGATVTVTATTTVWTTAGASQATTVAPSSTSQSSLTVAASSKAAVQSQAPPSATLGNDTAGATPPASYKNALYFTNWGIYGANFQPQQLPASQITHVLYAFADIGSDGEVKSSDSYADLQKHYPTDSWNEQGNNAYGCVKQLYLLKKKNRQIKVLLSIGGWTYSPKFPPIAATDSGRQKFASSAVKLVQGMLFPFYWGLDGIDIDWEYPANADEAQNFILLLQACRQAFDDYEAKYAPGYHLLITIAAPAGPSHYQVMDLKGMDPYVDAWNLMAYDYAGSWDSTSGHQANIYSNGQNPTATKFNTEQAVRDYIVGGIPANKIVMGMPLYGRSFEATTGLGQPYNGIGAGTIQSGVWLYRDLPRVGAQEMYDDVAKASYSFDAAAKELISYDTVASAVTKAQYLIKKGLGGAVFWEASGDRSGAQSLVGTLATQMRDLDPTQNLLTYPASQYDNIRQGMS
ncbi:ThEn42 [Diplogelasinospora grovesii]|uniref:chitinase n=1 Tax=Diplogelasinospora grovesii TaxID=303347 RepID=A0AAN6S239_9PEZI|nr:ThEn42 [Diplogelasinospora grovesii]